MDKKEAAKMRIRYYFRLIAKESGINWDWDNDAEVESIVDLIIEAAVEAAVNEVKTNK